ERGYALLGGTAPGPAKAEPVPLTPATPAADALCTILRSCIRHYRLNESLLLRSDDSEAVHQARVALRRLRTALWVFRP
ncbi:CHAD domain-containing protein, partial [Staphylococcus aureus]